MRQRLVILTRPSAKRVLLERYGSEGQTRLPWRSRCAAGADFARAVTEDTAQSARRRRRPQGSVDDVKLVEIDRAWSLSFSSSRTISLPPSARTASSPMSQNISTASPSPGRQPRTPSTSKARCSPSRWNF